MEYKFTRNIFWGRPALPDSFQASEFKDLVSEWAWILPSWIHDLILIYDPDSEGFLKCETEPDYLSFRILVADSFFVVPFDRQLDGIIHEFCHAYTTPQTNVLEEFLKVKLSEEDHKIAGMFVTNALESSTEHLSKFLMEHIVRPRISKKEPNEA